MKQTTFMMLKPDAFENGSASNILRDLENAGLCIESGKEISVDMHVMQTLLLHYEEVINKFDKSFNYPGKMFNTFYYKENPKIYPMKVSYEGEDIIAYTRTLVGATNPVDADADSIRGKYSKDSYDLAGFDVRLVNNLIHASDSLENAEKELALWSEYLK